MDRGRVSCSDNKKISYIGINLYENINKKISYIGITLYENISFGPYENFVQNYPHRRNIQDLVTVLPGFLQCIIYYPVTLLFF